MDGDGVEARKVGELTPVDYHQLDPDHLACTQFASLAAVGATPVEVVPRRYRELDDGEAMGPAEDRSPCLGPGRRRNPRIRWPNVTREGTGFFNRLTGKTLLNVFVPTTPNPTSGFLLLVPDDDVIRVPVDVEEGLKMVISGGAFAADPLQQSVPDDLRNKPPA